MSVREVHRSYLKQRFTLDIGGAVFSPAELELLAKYGNWLKALESGTIHPITREQERFLQVVEEKAEPSNPIEAVWMKYKRRSQALAEMSEIPHYELHDGPESWYSEAAYRRGIHFLRHRR